jgi:hypothetical protein
MDLRPARLRLGELLAGAAAVVLLVLLLATRWYGARSGWQALTSARWAVIITVAAAFVLVLTQAACRAPAIPSVMSVIVTLLALITALWLLDRAAISHPPQEHVWAWLGLASACLLLEGAFLSLRREGILPEDGPQKIPLVTVPSVPGRAQAPD